MLPLRLPKHAGQILQGMLQSLSLNPTAWKSLYSFHSMTKLADLTTSSNLHAIFPQCVARFYRQHFAEQRSSSVCPRLTIVELQWSGGWTYRQRQPRQGKRVRQWWNQSPRVAFFQLKLKNFSFCKSLKCNHGLSNQNLPTWQSSSIILAPISHIIRL